MSYPRFCRNVIQEALKDTPAVILTGGRQTGKSTLISTFNAPTALTFDDWATRQSAASDPEGFIQSISGQSFPVAIDEVQMVPEIFLPIKKAIDAKRQPGMFLLTGSANLLHWPQLPDSLAGRVEYTTLYPLSLSEILNHKPHWIDDIFDNPTSKPSDILHSAPHNQVENIITHGGYPEAFRRDALNRREAWLEAYVKTLIERDIRDLETIENPFILYQLMTHIALNVGSLVNFSNTALKLQISVPTVQKYMRLLSLLYLCSELPAWHKSLGKRLVKTPKLYLSDTGLLQYFTHSSSPENRGVLTEHFVFNELQKQISWSKTKPHLYFWRTSNGREVDFLLEDRRGQVVGIEVKSSVSASLSDFANLKALQADILEQFLIGLVFYKGDKILPFGPKLYAVPLSMIF